jgi:hypothetical protein
MVFSNGHQERFSFSQNGLAWYVWYIRITAIQLFLVIVVNTLRNNSMF